MTTFLKSICLQFSLTYHWLGILVFPWKNLFYLTEMFLNTFLAIPSFPFSALKIFESLWEVSQCFGKNHKIEDGE